MNTLPPSKQALQGNLRRRRIETCPILYRPALARSFSPKCSARQRVKAMCLECLGFVRAEITACTAYACPLWLIRPYQEKRVSKPKAQP